MRVTKWIEFSEECEVDISSEDIVQTLLAASTPEGGEKPLLRALNISLSWIQKVPDEAILGLPQAARETLAKYLLAQAGRFAVETPEGAR